MEAQNSQSFITELSEICRLSGDLPWQTAIQQTLALFAQTAQTQNVALLLLDESCMPLYCTQHQQPEVQVLCIALQKYASRWQKGLARRGFHTLIIHELVTPMWLLPIPPNSETPRAVMVFTDVGDAFPQALLEQGGALVTPLMHNALMQCERESSRIKRPSDSVITRQQRQRQTYLESLYTLISTINTATNLEDILTTGLSQAMQIADMVQGEIYLLDKKEQVLKLSVCLGSPLDGIDQKTTFMPGEGGPGRALVQKWMVVEHDPPVAAKDSAEAQEPQSHVNLPLIVEGKAVGVMRLSTLNKQALSLEVTQLLVTIADQLALTLQRGQLADQMREQLQIMHRLYEITTAFLSQSSSHGTIFLLLRALHDNISGAIGTAFYRVENGQWVRSQVYASGDNLFKAHWTEGPVWEGEASFLEASRQERMQLLTEARRDEFPTLWEHVAAVRAKQVLYLPLFASRDDRAGIVAVLMAEENALDENETILAWAIVQQGIAALVRINLYEATQKSESLMRAILESSRDGIILVGFDTGQPTIRYLNGPTLRMLALPGDTTHWESRALPEMIEAAAANAPKLAEWLTEAAGQVQKAVDIENTVEETTAESRYVPVFETASGLTLLVQRWDVYAEQNQSLGALFLFRDVTEVKALERMREDLLNMLVHDMRNPLSAAQHALHLLQDPEMQDVTDGLINIAITSTERLTKLVETILEISRLESGRFELQQQALILADHVAEIVKNTFASADNIQIEVDVPYTLPFLWVDASAITRVFENLFSNARKFVPKQAGRIRVAAIQEGKWVQVEVYNNGPHIPPETQKLLFTKFVAGQYQGRGYGLGLAFCRLVVEAHGGKIWIRNQPEGGVSFYFTLPIWEDPDADEDWE
ncbi:MAG: GAF domain-containing sensor histidine kinase [Anaerolineae bacterium]